MNAQLLCKPLAATLLLGATLQAGLLGTPTLTVFGPEDSSAPNDIVLALNASGMVNASGQGVGYTWSISGNSDPIINWGFSATLPGAYHMTFFLPVVPGFYTSLTNQASVALSDIGNGTSSTTISSITIDGQVPDGTSIPGVLLTGGPISIANGTTGSAAFGPLTVSQIFANPSGMQIVMDFVLDSPDMDGSVGLSGQLLLVGQTTGGGDTGGTPEPPTSALIGLGLVGIALMAKRFSRAS